MKTVNFSDYNLIIHTCKVEYTRFLGKVSNALVTAAFSIPNARWRNLLRTIVLIDVAFNMLLAGVCAEMKIWCNYFDNKVSEVHIII